MPPEKPAAQVIFNAISAAEMANVPKLQQLELLAGFRASTTDLDSPQPEQIGVIQREGKRLYRYRLKDWRVYFERVPEGFAIHRIFHRNTLLDFLYRSNLPVAEDEQLGEAKSFWRLIEEGKASQRSD